jgi:hypothetical protein
MHFQTLSDRSFSSLSRFYLCPLCSSNYDVIYLPGLCQNDGINFWSSSTREVACYRQQEPLARGTYNLTQLFSNPLNNSQLISVSKQEVRFCTLLQVPMRLNSESGKLYCLSTSMFLHSHKIIHNREQEPWQFSRYNNWLQDGQPRGPSLGPVRDRNFHFLSSKPALWSTQPPIQRVPGALSPEVRQPGYEADHSPPSSAEVKKTWLYTSTPPYVFMV